MATQKPVICPENEDLAQYMWNKRKEMAESNSLSERIDSTLYKAYCKLCNTKTPIKTIKEFSEVNGVGKWTVTIMKGFFKKDDDDGFEAEESSSPNKGKRKRKGPRQYVPQKNSVPYALLITLYRGTSNGSDFMRKQELIDTAEASGLSRVPIAPVAGKGKIGQFGFGGSGKEMYSGWTSMKTLIAKGLVVKSSCPAKYMLTKEGCEAARECLSRSGLADYVGDLDTPEPFESKDIQGESNSAPCRPISGKRMRSDELRSQEKSFDVPVEFLEKIVDMGYSVEQVRTAFKEVSKDTQSKDVSSLLPAVIHLLQKSQVDVLLSVCRQTTGKVSLATSSSHNSKNFTSFSINREFFLVNYFSFFSGRGSHLEEIGRVTWGATPRGLDSSYSTDSAQSSFNLRACSSLDNEVHDAAHSKELILKAPPLRLGEKFGEVYDVILVLDDREKFVNSRKGDKPRKLVDCIRTEFKIQIEIRRLPVGDAIWIARHKQLEDEYVLDFIVERKEVDDLRTSIRDNRYRDQKLRLLRCGLQKLIYVVEGDPNASEAAESIKTACFTTEILEGFDVQRTSGLSDTLRKYGHLTLAITRHYTQLGSKEKAQNPIRTCPSFDDFLEKCEDLEKMTVSDVFAIQLMQVPQVTEEIALAVVSLYPTVISLAQAYSVIDGDTRKQEEMLMNQSNNTIGRAASKNIFKLVWGS
ncbi:Crossover junction endonuclease mus81 [Ranunculus cassubicifolius]